MTEKEKMLAGELYNASDEILVNERNRAYNLCFEYNSLNKNYCDRRKEIVKELLGKVGENFNIESDFRCDYGYNIEVGENFYSNYNLVILDVNKVLFGNNVFIGPNCSFYTAGHPIDPKVRNSGLEFGKPITVGNNVWIGGNTVILPGITIGNNVTIGAGSVVTKNVEANSVVAGNPARVIKKI